MTWNEPGTLCREHRACIEGTATPTCQSAGPQVDEVGAFARSDQKVRASQDECASPEARGGSGHLVIHAASVSKECRFDDMPAATEAPEILAPLPTACKPEARSRKRRYMAASVEFEDEN